MKRNLKLYKQNTLILIINLYLIYKHIKMDKTLPNGHTFKFFFFFFKVSHDVIQLPQTTFLIRILLFNEEIQQDCVASSY